MNTGSLPESACIRAHIVFEVLFDHAEYEDSPQSFRNQGRQQFIEHVDRVSKYVGHGRDRLLLLFSVDHEDGIYELVLARQSLTPEQLGGVAKTRVQFIHN